jgi:hypothetical protein
MALGVGLALALVAPASGLTAAEVEQRILVDNERVLVVLLQGG